MTKTQTKKVTVKDVLIKARSLLRQGWTQGASRRDGKTGEWIDIDAKSSGHCQYCATGAISRAMHVLNVKELYILDNDLYSNCINKIKKIVQKNDFNGVVSFNDDEDTEKKDVIAVFDKAIDTLEKCRKS